MTENVLLKFDIIWGDMMLNTMNKKDDPAKLEGGIDRNIKQGPEVPNLFPDIKRIFSINYAHYSVMVELREAGFPMTNDKDIDL